MRVRETSLRCPRCKWPFRCPIEQIDERVYCRACESRQA